MIAFERHITTYSTNDKYERYMGDTWFRIWEVKNKRYVDPDKYIPYIEYIGKIRIRVNPPEYENCPCCGGKAELKTIEDGEYYEEFIRCVECGLRTSGDDSNPKLVWNTRAEPDELPIWILTGFKTLIDEIFADVKTSPCCLNEWKKEKLKEVLSLKRGDNESKM